MLEIHKKGIAYMDLAKKYNVVVTEDDRPVLIDYQILMRQYFPKGTNLNPHSQVHLNKVARRLNERLRKTLDYETPAERFNACVALTG